MTKSLHPPQDQILQAAGECHRALKDKGIQHVIIGGMAVYLHGDAQRKHRDVDLIVRSEEAGMIMVGTLLAFYGYNWDTFRKAPLHPNGVRVEPHWDGKDKRRLPYPGDTQVQEIGSLPVITLQSLLQMKLACLLGGCVQQKDDLKHRRDLVTLIRIKGLTESYAEELDVTMRDRFRELVRETNGSSTEKVRRPTSGSSQ